MRRYSPGSWFGVVTDAGIAVLPGHIAPALLERVYRQLESGNGLSALLDALTGEFGTGLASLPPFAIVTFVGDEARIAVRGALTVTAEGDAEQGRLRVSGARVTTWSESVSVTPESITIETDAPGAVLPVPLVGEPNGTPQPIVPPSLPIVTGVVLLRSFVAGLRPGVEATAPVVCAAAEETEPPELPRVDAQVAAPVAAEPVAAVPVAAEPVANVPVANVPVANVRVEPDATGETLAVPEFTQGLDYDGLWGTGGGLPPMATPPAAVTAVSASAPGAEVGGEIDTDHDGETLSLEQLRALGLAAPAASAVAGMPSWAAAPTVRHGRLLVSTGAEVLLDRGAVIGRKPSAARFTADRMPHLITVPSPQQDISRSHLEVRCEGENVLAVDLGTTNGTRLLRPGADPVRLHPQEPTMLVDGDVLDLGDAVTVIYREPA